MCPHSTISRLNHTRRHCLRFLLTRKQFVMAKAFTPSRWRHAPKSGQFPTTRQTLVAVALGTMSYLKSIETIPKQSGHESALLWPGACDFWLEMSALGQKQTCALHKVMSALPVPPENHIRA